MKRRGRLGAELALVILVLLSMAGALVLVVSVHHRSITGKEPAKVQAVAEPSPTPVVIARSRSRPRRPAAKLAEIPEDPTPKAVAAIASQTQAEREKAAEADRKADALEAAEKTARDEADRWRTRQSLVSRQIEGLADQASKLELEVDELARERDALASLKEKAQNELNRAKFPTGVAILPYKGPSGTWRRPIAIECANGEARLQPNGPAFGLFELSRVSGVGPMNPLVRAVARALYRAGETVGPDGGQVVPYIYFVIRPDGVRPYYEARARLEPLGIAFGFELVDQETPVEFPDLDNPVEWRDAAANDPATPSGRSAPASRDPVPFDGGPAWPPRITSRPTTTTDPTTLPKQGTYANSSMVRGEADPRRRLDLDPSTNSGFQTLNRQLTQPAPLPPGRVELTDDDNAVIPSLAPTPPSTGPGAMAGLGPDRMPNLPGRNPPNGGLYPGQGPSGLGVPSGSNALGSSSAASRNGSTNSGGAGNFENPGRTYGPSPGSASVASAVAAPPAGELPGGSGSQKDQEGDSGNGGSSLSSGYLQALAGLSSPGTALGGGGGGRTGQPSASTGSGGSTNDDRSGLGLPGDPANTGQGSPLQGSTIARKGAGTGNPTGSLPDSIAANGSKAANPVGIAPRSLSIAQPLTGLDRPSGSESNDAAYMPFSSGTTPSSSENPSQDPSRTTGSPSTSTLFDPSIAGNPNGSGSIPVTPTTIPDPSLDGTGSSSDPTQDASSNPGSSPTSGKKSQKMTGTPPPGAQANGTAAPMGGTNHAPIDLPPKLTIEPTKVPFEIVIACGPKGVTVHPGGYRFSVAKIDDRDEPLVKTLKSLERAQKRARPKDDIRPSLKFLIEPGGQAAFHKAREHTLLGGVNWPSTIKVSESNPMRVFAREAW